MNIGQLVQQFIGDVRAKDSKVLELKAGQTVRGTVLQLLANNEALLDLNGVTVKATLETPLKQGETTWLNVQPQSAHGQLILKPVPFQQLTLDPMTLASLLESFAADPKNNQHQLLIKMMHAQGIPMQKSEFAALSLILSDKPAHVATNEWIQSAVMLREKGMPLSSQSVSALHQVLFGKPMMNQVQTLQSQLQQFMPTSTSSGQHVQLLQQQLQHVMQHTAAFQALNASASLPNQTNQGANGINQSLLANQNVPSPASHVSPSNMPTFQATSTVMETTTLSGSKPSEQAAIQAQANPSTATASNISGNAAASGMQPSTTETSMGQLLKALGVHYEQNIAKILNEHNGLATKEGGAKSGSVTTANQEMMMKQLENVSTLKGSLLQLVKMEDVPPSIKETAQQLIQQITGQQLLLSSDRQGVFTHVTMQLPLPQTKEDHHPSITISSRRGQKGELDAENCRMMFDLCLTHLGNTFLDVKVTNKIVSVTMHNDHAFVAPLTQAFQQPLFDALKKSGYHLSSIQFDKYPDYIKEASEKDTLPLTQQMQETNKMNYKRVDIKI
ncbi:hypothetical protein [Longirhabdus pacifica]|uniref:hypothetical protein n=1 Tax=Longirhabdus pacifica TaxID=2305227 RepID=UPI0010091BF1|nr:hypothetical protein [Longirhabdus pacifica]